MFTAQFFLAETQKRAKRRVHKEELSLQVFHRNPDGTRIENITKKLGVGRRNF
jgi:hypothetical protein